MSVYTFGQLKTSIRQIVFPTGEADNLVASHDKTFIDAIVDLQTWVQCLQEDHIDVIPQCATLYECGLTVINPAPRGNIFRLTAVDKFDPTTYEESATGTTDYCRPIEYKQVEPILIRDYLDRSRSRGWCLSIPWFFAFPYCGCAADDYPPVPTDEGVPEGLPLLPLGYHYPQTSTDSSHGRANWGVWAVEHGKLYIAPWIQSTETILIEWDGIKRTWTDADAIDPDPLLAEAVEEYLRWKHADKWDRDYAEAQRAAAAYQVALQKLIYNCRQETRVRYRETSQSRASVIGLNTLFYNTDQNATATCPTGYTGDPVSVTIPAGTVASNVSVADANQKALAQAEAQAQAQLVCTATPTTYYNDQPGVYTATYADCNGAADAPTPTATSIQVIIPVGTIPSTVSIADANTQAQDEAESQAKSKLVCRFYNRAKTATATCASDGSVPEQTATVAASQYHVDVTGATDDAKLAAGQVQADRLAETDAQNQANALIAPLCTGDNPSGTPTYNTIQTTDVYANGSYYPAPHVISHGALISLHAIMPAGLFSSTGTDAQLKANQKAIQELQAWAISMVNALSSVVQPKSNPHYQAAYPGAPVYIG